MNYGILRRWVAAGLMLVAPLVAVLPAGPAGSAIDGFSPEVFRRCGLDKLSPSELAELKQQLDTAMGAGAAASPAPLSDLPRGEDAFGREEEVKRKVEVRQEIPDSIASRLVGEFHGWSGDTVFTLENGQVWRQSGKGSTYVRLQSPAVTIERGQLGAYFLRVEGVGARVKVKRLK